MARRSPPSSQRQKLPRLANPSAPPTWTTPGGAQLQPKIASKELPFFPPYRLSARREKNKTNFYLFVIALVYLLLDSLFLFAKDLNFLISFLFSIAYPFFGAFLFYYGGPQLTVSAVMWIRSSLLLVVKSVGFAAFCRFLLETDKKFDLDVDFFSIPVLNLTV